MLRTDQFCLTLKLSVHASNFGPFLAKFTPWVAMSAKPRLTKADFPIDFCQRSRVENCRFNSIQSPAGTVWVSWNTVGAAGDFPICAVSMDRGIF